MKFIGNKCNLEGYDATCNKRVEMEGFLFESYGVIERAYLCKSISNMCKYAEEIIIEDQNEFLKNRSKKRNMGD